MLNGALSPSSASRRCNYVDEVRRREGPGGAEKSTDAEGGAVTRDAAEQLRADVSAATAEAPVVLVASEDRARFGHRGRRRPC